MIAKEIAKICSAKIDWDYSAGSQFLLVSEFEGRLIELRLNDFPDEPLCTLIVEGRKIDLDDFPKSWTLPRHRSQ